MSRVRRATILIVAVLALLFVGLAVFNPAPVSAGGGIDNYTYTCVVVDGDSYSNAVVMKATATERYRVGRQWRTRSFVSAEFYVYVTPDYWERTGQLLSVDGSEAIRMEVYKQGYMVGRAVTCSVTKSAQTRWQWKADGVNVTTSW